MSAAGSHVFVFLGPTFEEFLQPFAASIRSVTPPPNMRALATGCMRVDPAAASSPFRFDLGAVRDECELKEIYRRPRGAEAAPDAVDSAWFESVPAAPLSAKQVCYRIEDERNAGRWHTFWRNAFDSVPAAIHLLCLLGEGAAWALPPLIEDLVCQIPEIQNTQFHLHTVLPDRIRLSSKTARQASRLVSEINEIGSRSPVSVNAWLQGGSLRPTRDVVQESIAACVGFANNSMTPTWETVAQREADSSNVVWGTYRFQLLEQRETVDVSERGFVEDLVPIHRRDEIGFCRITCCGYDFGYSNEPEKRWNATKPGDSKKQKEGELCVWMGIDVNDIGRWLGSGSIEFVS